MTIQIKNPVDALKLWQAAEGIAGHGFRSQAQAQFALSESVAQGDFPTQIVPAVKRTLTAVYDQTPTEHQRFTTRKTVQAIDVDEQLNVFDFGDQSNLEGVDGGDEFITGGLPRLGPREKYQQIGMKASGKTIRASKIGEAFGIDWEAIVRMRGTNVNLIREAVEAFGRHARNQEDIDIAKLLVSRSGFQTAALTAAGASDLGNVSLDDPEALPNILSQLLEKEVEGYIPGYSRYALLTAPSNVAAAQRSIDTRTLTRVPPRTGTGSAAVGQQYEQTVALPASVEVIGWRWLQRMWGGIGKGFILVPLTDGDDLPVISSNYLEGNETPSMWVKDSNARRIAGGAVDALVDGDFDSDAVETKVRHVHGGTLLWGAGIGFSTGTGA